MQPWVQAFVVIAAIAIVVQTAILLALMLQLRSLGRNIVEIMSQTQRRVEPILLRVHGILEDSHERISSVVADAAEMTRLARGQAQKLDRVFTEAADRLQGQIIRADQMVTGVMAVIEETGSLVRRSVWPALGRANALITGLRAGLEVFRGRRHSERDNNGNIDATVGVTQDEELFI